MPPRLPKCVRSGPNVPVSVVPRMAWQLPQPTLLMTCLPATASAPVGSAAGCCWRLTQAEYSCGRHHDEEEAHLAVLHAAELGALAEVRARSVSGHEVDVVDVAGDHVDLAAHLRHPERVDDVGGLDVDGGRCGPAAT